MQSLKLLYVSLKFELVYITTVNTNIKQIIHCNTKRMVGGKIRKKKVQTYRLNLLVSCQIQKSFVDKRPFQRPVSRNLSIKLSIWKGKERSA